MSKEQGGIPIDKLTKTFIKIRTKRAELVANFKEEEEILVQQEQASTTFSEINS